MTLKEMEIHIKNLEHDMKAFAGRNFSNRIDNVKGEVQNTNINVEDLDREIAETALTLTELIMGGSENV